MRFNEFVWNTYKSSPEGKDLIEVFRCFEERCRDEEKRKAVVSFLNSIRLINEDEGDLSTNIECYLNWKGIVTNELKPIISNEDEAGEFLLQFWDVTYEEDPAIQVFSLDDVDTISTVLYMIKPEYYFPYFFNRQFISLKNIFNEFGIFLPAVPAKNKYEELQSYYWEICKSISEFRKKYNMESYELPAFIYGFAMNVIEKYSIKYELPEAKKAFFVGGGLNNNGDFEYLDNAGDETIYSWQGNPEIQPGDIVVMYCLTPRSYIHSIWRAVTPGFIDPFFDFYRATYIGKPILVENISIKEIKEDEVLSNMPLVRGNMQGINGRLIEKKYYDRILELLKSKGQDISILPRLENLEIEDVVLKNEKDIEKKLLEPLLNKLGYESKNWKKQFAVKMGRKEKIIPDYVLDPVLEKGNESGYWVWEAKYTISSHKQLKKDFDQAKSYALRLQSEGLGLISKEGIWLCKNSFDFKNLKFWNWKQISERDSFNEIYDYLGKKTTI